MSYDKLTISHKILGKFGRWAWFAGRFEDDFVSQRLRQLQAWVDRMCKHPVVAHSDVFQHFLTCTDDKVVTH